MSSEDATAPHGERVDPQLLTVLTTEHFVLQTARGATISEANGRAAIYLGTLSSGLIALGFVAGDQRRFPAFLAVVLPALMVLGQFTFVRMVARGREKILVDGQLSPGWRTPEILVRGQVISVVTP